MKFPLSQLTCYCLCLVVFLPHFVSARIGESRLSLEGRLLNSGGIVYRDDEAELNRRRGMPYLQYLPYLEGSVDVRIYFKTADGRKPMSSELDPKRMGDGWDLHVVYIGGKSAVEVYKRSRGITEYEMNELLARQAGGAYWQRKEKPSAGEETEPTAFGYDMIRSDGRVCAKKMGGDALLLFNRQVDLQLATMKEADLIEQAPVSAEGF